MDEERQQLHPTKMTRESESHSKSADDRSSSSPTLLRGKIQPSQAEAAEGGPETAMIAPKTGGQDPEKAVNTYDSVPEENLGTIPPKTTAVSPEITANPTSRGNFDEEDKEYISGYKLYVALFGIISVFFLVLLDFSITATVSTGSLENHFAPGALHRSADDDHDGPMLAEQLTTVSPRFRGSGYPVHYE